MIELGWLNHKAKDLTPPALFVVEGLVLGFTSGCYYRPFRGEVVLDGRCVSTERGLIVISGLNESRGLDSQEAPNALAHEWRHHWQTFNVRRGLPSHWGKSWSADYENSIVKFFKNPHEMDALLFSYHIAPCETTRLWLSFIQKNMQMNKETQ